MACFESGIGGDTFVVHTAGPVHVNGQPIDHGNGVYTVSYSVDTDSHMFASAFQVRNVIQIDVSFVNPRYVCARPGVFAVMVTKRVNMTETVYSPVSYIVFSFRRSICSPALVTIAS